MCETTTIRKGQTVPAAHGFATVCTDRVECHNVDGWESKNVSGTVRVPKGYNPDTDDTPRSYREAKEDTMLAYLAKLGMARKVAGGTHRDKVTGARVAGGFHWEMKCATTGAWLRKATQGEETRADRAVWSHVVSAENGGAWCSCNIVPERGALNAARGGANMTINDDVARVLEGWPAYFAAHVARPATRKRLM